MERIITTILLCLTIGFGVQAQDRILWKKDIVITQESFQAVAPEMIEDNLQQYSFYTTWDFGYQMANIQFAMTKNFNNYVSAYYMPNLSWMESGELTEDLILAANLYFDVSELYARKFRKELYHEKNFGSRVDFYDKAHKKINAEFIAFSATLNSELSASRDWPPILTKYSEEVNVEIETLHEFCKTCKPAKKKKRKKKG